MPFQVGNVSITSGAGAQYTSTPTTINIGARIKADPANTDKIVVGLAGSAASASLTYGSAASTDGYPLAAGDEIPIPSSVCNDLSKVWVRSASGTQKANAYGS